MSKVTIDFSRILKDIKGETIRDMIDPPQGRTAENAPALTLGTLFVYALTIGTNSENMKQSLKLLRLAQAIEEAMQAKGTIEYDEGALSQLEEALGKVQHPMFKTPIYGGQMMDAIEKAKLEFLRQQRNEKIKTD